MFIYKIYFAGIDVSANQLDEEIIHDTEIFQIEYHKDSKKWAMRTKDNKYWSLKAGGGIHASSQEMYVLFCVVCLVSHLLSQSNEIPIFTTTVVLVKYISKNKLENKPIPTPSVWL